MERPAPDPGRDRSAGSGAATVGKVRTQPTQQGTVYLWTIAIFSAVMWYTAENLVFFLGALALGCGAVAWFLARRNLRGLSVAREAPLRTQAGTPTSLAWVVTGRGERPAVGVELEDRPARGLRPHCLQVDLSVVRGAEGVRCESPVVFGRRGLIDLGTEPIEVASRYPLGLFRSEGIAHVRGRVMVRPREGHVTRRLRARLRGRAEVDARRTRTWSGDDVIYGVREFREGDDPRRIHWRSTARRGATIVSEWRAEQGDETLIVLGLAQGAGRPAAAAFERAVSCAATIWRACSRERLHARLVLGVGRDPTMGENGRGLERGLDALATVVERGPRRPRSVLKRLAEEGAGRRSIVYIGSGLEPGLETELKAAAGRGGTVLLMRADLRSILRWVRGVER